jgi:hypothetical protein
LAGATIDHLVSVTIFIAALLLFISLFNQTIQTAVIYQQHRTLATKCSDLLDTMLLTPNDAAIINWTVFGLQDPEFTQYVLNPFSIMRLNSSTGTPPVYYGKTGKTYSNVTVGFGNSLLMPMSDVVDYSSALNMLGINNAYGFNLTLTPIVNVSIAEVQSSPLKLSINVRGVGFPLANASLSYRLLPVSLNGAYPDYLAIQDQTGTVYTDAAGFKDITFQNFTPNATLTYAFVAYAQVGSLAGVGFYVPPSSNPKVIPFVDALSTKKVILAHSYDVPNDASFANTLAYNATFVFWNEYFGLQTMALANSTGTVTSGAGGSFGIVTIPSDTLGVLLIAYNGTAGGVAVVPWGVGSLAFPVTFGGNPTGQEWVATDMRQVLVGGVAYQAKLSLWSLQGIQVVG